MSTRPAVPVAQNNKYVTISYKSAGVRGVLDPEYAEVLDPGYESIINILLYLRYIHLLY